MATLALLIRLDARTGKEEEVEALLHSIQPPATALASAQRWFGLRMAPEIYGLFSTFDNESDRDAYLSGLDEVWARYTSELLSRPPVIEKISVLAKQPHRLTEPPGFPSKIPGNTPERPAARSRAETPKVGSTDAPGG